VASDSGGKARTSKDEKEGGKAFPKRKKRHSTYIIPEGA
jgi:hypothetical protein